MRSYPFWETWAHFLQRFKLDRAAALFLDAAGPFKILLAQTIYFGQPLLAMAISDEECSAIAELLENTAESRSFIDFLLGEGTVDH